MPAETATIPAPVAAELEDLRYEVATLKLAAEDARRQAEHLAEVVEVLREEFRAERLALAEESEPLTVARILRDASPIVTEEELRRIREGRG